MSGAVPLLPYMSSWRGGDNYTCLCVNFFPLYLCGLLNDAAAAQTVIVPSRRTIRDNLSFFYIFIYC